MAMTVFMILPFVGEPTVEYYYTRTRYHWDYEEFSQYTSTINTCALIGKTFQYPIQTFVICSFKLLALGILVPLLRWLNINDSLVMSTVYGTIIARAIIKAFASEGWMFYVGKYTFLSQK